MEAIELLLQCVHPNARLCAVGTVKQLVLIENTGVERYELRPVLDLIGDSHVFH